MYKVMNDFQYSNGTSRVSEIEVVLKDVINAFGEPMESDEYKVSGEWVFVGNNGEVFTLYDWKMTSLYDEDLPSPEELRASNDKIYLNIGGHRSSDVDEFKSWLLQSIEYAKLDKPFRKIMLSEEE